MKKLFLVLCVSAFIFGSCSKSDDAPVVVEPVVENLDNILIKQIIESNGTAVANTTTFTYDGKKILKTEDTQGQKIVYTYVGDLITKKVTSSNNSIIETENFAYNSANKLISYSSLEAGSSNAKFEYYAVDSQDLSNIYFNNYLNDNYITGSSIDGNLNFLNNELEKAYYEISLTSSAGAKAKYTNTYVDDRNKSFYKNITGFKNIAYAGFKNLYTGYDRNVKKVTRYKINTGTNVETTSTITWVYTYNLNDFPASSVKTAVSTAGTTTTTNITYVY